MNAIELFSYQREWLLDGSRFKIGLWARQTGKDHTCALEAVSNCMSQPKSLWIILAAGERQALESMAKAKEFAQELKFEVESYEESSLRAETDSSTFGLGERGGTRSATSLSLGARLGSAQITWENGSRLLALPSNPATIRGYSANLILTEFAFHEKPEEIWRAVYPSISNPLRGGLKKLRIISTPNGLNNKFAELWRKGNGYFRSRVTIHDAIRAGLPLNAEELRAGLDDEEAWQQEYLCEFMDNSSVLLPYELIESCESAPAGPFMPDRAHGPQLSATEACALDHYPRSSRFFAGIDFGRKNHLTVCWLFECVPAQNFGSRVFGEGHNDSGLKFVTREVLVLKNMSTPEQLAVLRPRLQRCEKACIDYTGAGVGLGDYLAQEFGEWNPGSHRHGRIELCQFTAGLKAELFPKLRAAFERRELLIPSSREIREDLHGIHRIVSNSGQISYRALSKADGHSDRCTAIALALRAGQLQVPAASCAISIPIRRHRIGASVPRLEMLLSTMRRG
jgi:phage FluMu gp28-like protein